MTVYIQPQANTTLALNELYGTINKHKTAHPEAMFAVVGDRLSTEGVQWSRHEAKRQFYSYRLGYVLGFIR